MITGDPEGHDGDTKDTTKARGSIAMASEGVATVPQAVDDDDGAELPLAGGFEDVRAAADPPGRTLIW